MKPLVKEFQDDQALMKEVNMQVAKGIQREDLYVISHDDDRTDRVANKVDANTIGINEEGFATAMENIFRKKGDELRAKLEELGFNQVESEVLEEKLDHGKILLLIKDN